MSFLKLKECLLTNFGIRQTIYKNTFWLFFSEGVSQFFKLLLLIYAARVLGAVEYGKFTFALAFVSLFVLLSDFGLTSIITRELSQKTKKEEEFFAIFSLRIFLCFIVLILILISSFFITTDPSIRKIIWILSVVILISSFSETFDAFFRARQKMEYEAGIKILQDFLLVLFGLWVIFKKPSVENLSWGYLISAILSFIFILFFFQVKFFSLKISLDKKVWKKFLSLSWPIGLGSIFMTMCSYIDSTLMGHFGQIQETGWYNAAIKIVNFTFFVPALTSLAFFPSFSVIFNTSKEKFQEIFDHYLKIMIFFSIPLILGGILLAPQIINFIYNDSFAPSILIFQILIIMAGIFFVSNPFILVLIAANQQIKYFLIAFFAALFNLVFNLLLIPKFSFYGASIISLSTRLLILILLLLAVKKLRFLKIFSFNVFSFFLFSLFSSVLMYYILFIIIRFYCLPVIFLIILGMFVYFLPYFLYKIFFQKIKLII